MPTYFPLVSKTNFPTYHNEEESIFKEVVSPGEAGWSRVEERWHEEDRRDLRVDLHGVFSNCGPFGSRNQFGESRLALQKEKKKDENE